ncbi:MAG: LysM peptidoglycan-binding domain-containing protein [Moraxellaceae bacterium]|nr:LysM peptidoglycan-binding domain-containing protein [Moraxellaceae bacterium]
MATVEASTTTATVNLSEIEGEVAADAADADEEIVTILPTEDTEEAIEEEEPLLLDAQDIVDAGNLWERTRSGFKLDLTLDNERIAAQRNWYSQHQSHLDRVTLRAARYLHYTVSEAEQRGIPTELALLPVIESSYNPFAYSHASAAGMWQFIPGTGKIFGLKQNWWFDGRRDVIESTRAAYDFLTQLHNKFGSWELALAAYNAGPGAVQRSINRNLAEGLPADFWSLRLPSETMSYVPRFLAMAQLIKSPESFGVSLRPIMDQPYFRVVDTNGQIDLESAASLAGVSLKELYQLNPGFNRWATDPEGPHRLLIPASLPTDFAQQISALPAPERVAVENYTVKKGDTLFKVAKRFGTTPAELKRLNKLKSNQLKNGSTLVVSQTRNGSAEYARVQAELFGKSLSTASNKKIVSRYKVRRGDTLSSVARKHGVSTKQLAKLNGLRVKSHLKQGQVLKVNGKAGSTSRTASRGKAKGKGKRISYEVRKGDTLFSISKRYNVSVKQIRNWNSASRSIRPGQDLVIYVASSGQNRQGSL